VETAWMECGKGLPLPENGCGMTLHREASLPRRCSKETMRRRLLPVALLALAGCAEVSKLAASAVERPKLVYRSVELEALDLEGATLGFTFDLDNPNPFGLDLARIGYAVEAEGVRVAAGEVPGGLSIKARGKTPLTFPVRVRFQDVPGIAKVLAEHDRIPYRLSGDVGVRTPVGTLDLSFSHQDSVPAPRPPGFALEGLAVRSLSLSSMTLEVRLRVKNPNAFPVPAGRVECAIWLAGRQVATGAAQPTEALAPGKTAVVAVPFRLDLARAGEAASAVGRGAALPVRVEGKAALGGVAIPLELEATLPALR